MSYKIIITANTSWYIYNFRSKLISMILGQGHEVHIVAPEDDYSQHLINLGCHFHPITMDTQSTSPFKELSLLISFWQHYRKIAADLVLSFSIKNNIYSCLSGKTLGLPVLPNVSGLGQLFDRGPVLHTLGVLLYRLAFRGNEIIFFQNNEDRALFISQRLVRENNSERLPGSGVDLERFQAQPLPPKTKVPHHTPEAPATWPARFLLSARLIREKGVVQFADALRTLRARGLPAEGALMGFVDVPGRSAIGPEAITAWEREGLLEFLGSTDDVRPAIAQADCVVLPSYYREGVPRSLLEAAAMGRLIITTDHPGCRDVVDDGENGYLVQPQDSQSLADAMYKVLILSPEERSCMGVKSRQKMEHEFAESIILNRYRVWIDHYLKNRSH